MTSRNRPEELGHRFLAALSARDWDEMRVLFADDARWTMPGSGNMSLAAEGADAMVARARAIAESGVTTELLHVLVGAGGIALSLHNTARRPDGRVLDEYLATVLSIDAGRIVAIDTYLSDVAGMEAFYA